MRSPEKRNFGRTEGDVSARALVVDALIGFILTSRSTDWIRRRCPENLSSCSVDVASTNATRSPRRLRSSAVSFSLFSFDVLIKLSLQH